MGTCSTKITESGFDFQADGSLDAESLLYLQSRRKLMPKRDRKKLDAEIEKYVLAKVVKQEVEK